MKESGIVSTDRPAPPPVYLLALGTLRATGLTNGAFRIRGTKHVP